MIKSPYVPPRGNNNNDGLRINEQIRVNEVRLVDQNGEMVGVISTNEAQRMAEEVGLDLVEVSPAAEPPVCKILDYGKYRYEMQKKANEARKKQKTVDVKEIKLRPGIEKHDYEVKLRNAKRFLEDGDKVKVTLRFRGREMAHQEIGMGVMNRMKEDLSELGKVEMDARIEGRQAVMVLGPIG